MSPANTLHLDEDQARRVLLVQAWDASPADDPLWTADDRAWAGRVTREELPADAPAERVLGQRAHHALQRLAPRDAGVRQLLARRGWQPGWPLLAAALGLICGLAVDALGGSQRINLLAPPVWGVIAWNLLVYGGLLLPLPLRLPGSLRRWLAQRLAGRTGPGPAAAPAAARFHAAWLQQAAPLMLARSALLLHLAAAALGLGLIASLYLHGLVLDYRAGWQSTFLDAAQVQALLATLLAPAVASTGIAVPDAATLQALRVAADGLPVATPANGAAPWLHLYAAMLLLFVVLPRGGLALYAALRAGWLRRRLTLDVSGAYFQRLLREQRRQAARVQVLPHGAAPTPHARACLQQLLAAVLGPGLTLDLAPATAYGDEEAAAAIATVDGTALRVALLDLAATPEDDSHGAFVRALRQGAAGVPLLLLADEAAFAGRFASLPARLAERRATWAAWARAQQLPFVAVDLTRPDADGAQHALTTVLDRAGASS